MSSVSRSIDRVDVTFDDATLVANAGLLLPATLMIRLGLESLINTTVRLGRCAGAALPGRKVLTLVATILVGGSHIDHADMLRAGATRSVLPFRVMAPSTLGTFLRAFTFGHVRQLDRVIAEAINRSWSLGAGPGDGDLVIDIDSTIHEVFGSKKQGAGYGYTKVLGYHPILAVRADTGEVVHARMRKGQANTQRGTQRFIEELIARVRRCGARGVITMRFDAGFWSADTIAVLGRLGVSFTMAVRTGTKAVATAISSIDETSWRPIDYTPDGEAQVAECTYTTSRGRGSRQRQQLRLVVRRTRLVGEEQRRLWPDWRYHAFLTDLEGEAVSLDQFHRDHATVELAIRDLKEGSGLEHCPSGRFFANAAWLACAVLAHDLIRWSARLGDVHPSGQLTVARTLRTHLFAIPGRLVNRSGRSTLRMPTSWPWAQTFVQALDAVRALPAIASG